MITLYRVVPWISGAEPGEPGHPTHVPDAQGDGRIDNAGVYATLYTCESPEGAIAERFARRREWFDEMFLYPRPAARAALVELQTPATVLDLDDGIALADRSLRPSRVALRQRAVTQRWARAVFDEHAWDGIRWWSVWDSRWSVVGLWNHAGLTASEPQPLTRRHPAVEEAASVLGRLWID